MKRAAEAQAAENLEHARIKASLRPILDGNVSWRPPAANESRPGYAGLYHAEFKIGGRRKERGRAYIEVDAQVPGEKPTRTKACMADGTDRIAHEMSGLRPGQPYLIPVFTVVRRTSKFLVG
jgi:hypothetical protein